VLPGAAARVQDRRMNPRLSSRVLVAVSICYGIVVAILGALDSAAVGTVAMIGALAIGGLWVLRGLVGNRRPGS